MPRTPAPLTVTLEVYAADDGPSGPLWYVETTDGEEVAFFLKEADARAFVALPALEQKCRALIEQMRAAGDHLADSEQALVRFYSESTEQWADELDAALAQADGPAPKE